MREENSLQQNAYSLSLVSLGYMSGLLHIHNCIGWQTVSAFCGYLPCEETLARGFKCNFMSYV